MGKRDYAGALRSVERALMLNPSQAASHAVLGTAMLYAGDAAGATTALETALRLDPNLSSKWLLQLALADYMEGRYSDALRAVERNPINDSAVPLYYRPAILAAVHARMDDARAASAAADDVRSVWPFFKIVQLTNHFDNAEHRALLAEGLRAAGLD
jgi:tetratricopeptide (TPR) repeat protein